MTMARVSHGRYSAGVRTWGRLGYEKPLPRHAVPRGNSPLPSCWLALARRRLAPPARRNRPGGRAVSARACAGASNGGDGRARCRSRAPSRARARPTGRRQGRALKSSANSLAALVLGAVTGPSPTAGCTLHVPLSLAFTLPSVGFHRPGSREGQASARAKGGRWLRGARPRARATTTAAAEGPGGPCRRCALLPVGGSRALPI